MKSAPELQTHRLNVPVDVNLSRSPTFKNGNILRRNLGFWLCLQQQEALAAFPRGHSGVESGCQCPPKAEHPSSARPMVPIVLCCSPGCTAIISITRWPPWACECVTCGTVMLPRLKLEGGAPTGWERDVSWLSFPRPLALQACEPEHITATYQGSVSLSVKWMQKLPPSLKYGL